MESFEEKLSEIIHAEPILQLHPIQILTFLEILISQGCYDEAFSIIIRYDSSLYDVDMLFLLAKILADVGHESEWTNERREALDTCSREQYGEGSFREIIEDVCVKQVETLEQDDGSDVEYVDPSTFTKSKKMQSQLSTPSTQANCSTHSTPAASLVFSSPNQESHCTK